ncbi:ABC transporter permease subunit, partial [Desulfuromonas sp. TF]|uniref:ABC transporter permease subunit n=1 Tax=Desulfuromonas sp. TF TaxID=1232410 RepID=UPI00042449A7
MGPSRWQTVWRVILPSASPGIFAGTMIGFGRAIGETMIVLMATGNTAIMDWSIFNGMRPLSANIAVEIPEAPFGGTLYRILFLSAVILFAFTFILNTAAEIVRQRLRKKYGRF